MPDTTTTPPASQRSPSDATDVPETVLAIARDLAREIHPGRKAIERAGLDSLLDRDWGFDSLSRAELLLRAERAFATHLPEQLLGEAESLRDLVEALSRAKASSPVAQIPPRHAPAPEAAEPAPDSAATLTDVLDWHVREHGERVHVVVMEGDGRESALSYRQVSERARAVALGLQRRGLQPGERVAIMLPTGEAFFAAFFGILYAGGVPCPIYPPARLSRIEEHLRRQARILDNARAAMLIAPPEATAVATPAPPSGREPAQPRDGRRARVGFLARLAATCAAGERHGARAVHFGKHWRSQGRGSHPCQRPGQHPRHRRGHGGRVRRRLRQLAAPLP